MNSKTSHNIKNRKDPKDVFLTPIPLAISQINMIDYKDNDIWLDPFKNTGNYYNNYPNNNKDWCEILDDKDFFNYDSEVDIICSNPPYSIINPILEKCISLKPRVISLLLGVNNLTTKRIENMNKAGYGLYKLRMLKVNDWYGMSFIVHFELGKENCMEIDRTIYYSVK
tara:strand:+ start:1275 stop:1781 length:507 start_codon:yes stop_codon:yes gene_type:complete